MVGVEVEVHAWEPLSTSFQKSLGCFSDKALPIPSHKQSWCASKQQQSAVDPNSAVKGGGEHS